MSATRLKMPHKRGVVRSMARSDHCRWVSKPRRARNSSKVISMTGQEYTWGMTDYAHL